MIKAMKKIIVIILMSVLCSVNINAQGKAPWTITKHWISESPDNDSNYYYEAWIFGKKAKNHCDEEPGIQCNGSITLMYKDNVYAYIIMNYFGKNAKGYIYNAIYKSKEGSPVTGKLLVRVVNSSNVPSIKISALTGLLEGCDADGLKLIGTPTSLEE